MFFEYTIDGLGLIRYNGLRDTWMCYDNTGDKIDEIDANAFPTILEFKNWAKNVLTAESVCSIFDP